jgi:hypothetical protein
MITLAHVAEFVNELKGDVSEPTRTLIAKRLANLLSTALQSDPENYKLWINQGCKTFYARCELTCPERWVNDNLSVSETALSAFCNKWMSVEQFKLKDADEWQFVTPELNGLRATMIEELLALSKASA